MKNSVLITGASGFVGFHLIQEALSQGLKVFAAVRKTSDISHLKNMNVQFLNIDFQNKESLKKYFETYNFDYVIHAAGLTKARTLEEYNIANVQSTINLAEVAMLFPIKKFIFLSSLASLGPIDYLNPQLIEEQHIPNPVTNYGRSKLSAERDLLMMKQLPLLILRPTAVYGPREKDLLIMFKTLNRRLEPYIGKDGQWLSFVYVKDLCQIVLKSLTSPIHGEVYNISDGQAYSRYDLANEVKKVLGKKTIKFHVPMPVVRRIAGFLEMISRDKAPVLNIEKLNELAAENWKCSIEKAKRDLGYAPVYDLKAGIEET